MRFTKEEAEVWEEAARYIRTFEAYSEHERQPFGISKLFSEFLIKKVLGIFQELCAFWALGSAPSLDVPALFTMSKNAD